AGGGIDCGDVGGNANAGGGIDCGDVGGNASAGGDINCGDISGYACAGSDINCGDIEGDINITSDGATITITADTVDGDVINHGSGTVTVN
ncbi:MAG: hypothetical protein WCQ72_06460, partial [Eubacteriales bacterium]